MAELLKVDITTIVDVLHNLFCVIWDLVRLFLPIGVKVLLLSWKRKGILPNAETGGELP